VSVNAVVQGDEKSFRPNFLLRDEGKGPGKHLDVQVSVFSHETRDCRAYRVIVEGESSHPHQSIELYPLQERQNAVEIEVDGLNTHGEVN